jgi:uncharacterized oxidoreductase
MILKDKRVLITGGGSGIGLALAQALAARGCRVALCGRNAERVQAAARQVPGALAAVCDVRQPDAIAALDERLQQAWGGIDVLINNAGIAEAYTVQRVPHWLALAEAEVATNLLGPLRLISRFLPQLLTRDEAAIVNVTSGLALAPAPATPGYSAAKAGLRAFTRALRRQLRDTPVRVFELLPPMVDTPMVAESPVRKMSAAQVAARAVRGLERNRLEIAVGETRLLRAGVRIAPALVDAVLARHPFPMEVAEQRMPPPPG